MESLKFIKCSILIILDFPRFCYPQLITTIDCRRPGIGSPE